MNLKTAKLRDREASYISAREIAQAQVLAMDSIALAKAIALSILRALSAPISV
jgi:hypothetical protein